MPGTRSEREGCGATCAGCRAVASAVARQSCALTHTQTLPSLPPHKQGWLAYSRVLPPGGKPGQRLTFIEAKWKNLGNPRNSNSFYSPWFGIDTYDDLNLCV